MSDNDQSAGATPAASDATSDQSSQAAQAGTTATSSASASATGDDQQLGDAGQRALEAERTARRDAEKRAKAAEKERDDLKLASASDQERAVAEAKDAGKTEVLERMHAIVRRTAIKEALAANGAMPSLIADLARAEEFASLAVNDDDEVDAKELADAVKAHKARVPDAYKAPGSMGSADQGARGTAPSATEQARQAEAKGDFKGSIAAKSRQLEELRRGR